MNDNDYGSRQGLRLLPILIGVVLIGFTALRGCQEGPFGRHQVVGLNPEQESSLGTRSYGEVLAKSQVIGEGPVVEVVKRLASSLVAAAEREDVVEYTRLEPPRFFRWDATVVRSREVNAFCLPGGKIVVYTGILPVAETESALAAVMGHEIGHALAHHGAERMAQQQMLQIAQGAAAGATSNMTSQQQREVLGALGAGGRLGVLLPFSRKHESEADRIGLVLMAAAGHDPRTAVEFWRRMETVAGGAKSPEFLSTHPSNERRIRDLESLLPEVQKFYDAAPVKQKDRPLPAPNDGP